MMEKTYRTKGGRRARIYATDAGGMFPVHGAIECEGGWLPAAWQEDGSASLTEDALIEADIEDSMPDLWVARDGGGDWYLYIGSRPYIAEVHEQWDCNGDMVEINIQSDMLWKESLHKFVGKLERQ
jgi:hypothetical protein